MCVCVCVHMTHVCMCTHTSGHTTHVPTHHTRIHINKAFVMCVHVYVSACISLLPCRDGYSSTLQGLLDWAEVDLGFTELLFIQIGLCVMCMYQHASVRTHALIHINKTYA